MKTFFSRVLIALVLAALVGAGQAPAQRRPDRLPKGRRAIERLGQDSPPLNRRGNVIAPAQKRQMRQQLQRRLMQEIGLTQQQHLRIQDIRRSYDDQVVASGRRLRQARAALDRAIMSEQLDEALINRYAEELAAAQADKIRLDARIRTQVRSVLTPEQVTRFHEAQRRLRRQLREQVEREQVEREREMREQGAGAFGPRSYVEAAQFDLLSLLFPIN